MRSPDPHYATLLDASDRIIPDCDVFNPLPAPAKLPHCTIAARMLNPFKTRSSKFRFMHFVICNIPFVLESLQSNSTSDLQVSNIFEES